MEETERKRLNLEEEKHFINSIIAVLNGTKLTAAQVLGCLELCSSDLRKHLAEEVKHD